MCEGKPDPIQILLATSLLTGEMAMLTVAIEEQMAKYWWYAAKLCFCLIYINHLQVNIFFAMQIIGS